MALRTGRLREGHQSQKLAASHLQAVTCNDELTEMVNDVRRPLKEHFLGTMSLTTGNDVKVNRCIFF